MTKLYPGPMGPTTERPQYWPSIDRGAVMREAHRVAKGFRHHFASYREALAYGLRAAWGSAKLRREIQSLARQVGRPAVPFTAAQIEASRRATRSCGSSLWGA